MVESTGLLNRRRVNSLPQVRILSSPLENPGFTQGFSHFWPMARAVYHAHIGSVDGGRQGLLSRRDGACQG